MIDFIKNIRAKNYMRYAGIDADSLSDDTDADDYVRMLQDILDKNDEREL